MNQIESVANSSEISKMVFKALSEKQRARRATDLTHLYKAVQRMDKTISEREFLTVFKQLEGAKVGSLIIGRRNNHNRFVWNYNLKQVAQAATGKLETKALTPIIPEKKQTKKVIRRPKLKLMPTIEESSPVVADAQVTKSLTAAGPARIQLNLELAPEVSAKDIQALIELVNSLQKKK